MVADSTFRRLSPSPSLVAGSIVGLAAAVAAALLPTWRLESLVLDSGLPGLFPPAAPPLGRTARLALVLVAAAVAGGGTWAAVRRLAPVRRTPRIVTRRVDQHPDAPMRAPVMAMRDLGTPFLDVAASAEMPEPSPATVERTLPGDLNTPLAAFDPAAIPVVPMTPSAPVTPLFRRVADADAEAEVDAVAVTKARVETLELNTPVRPHLSAVPLPIRADAPPIPTIETGTTTPSLLDRLERGLRRRGGRPVHADRAMKHELDEALATLKRFAAPN